MVMVVGCGGGGGGGCGGSVGGGGWRWWGQGSRPVGLAALDFLFFYENCFAESNISSRHTCNESI
jgi:hypothetical protein